MDIKEAYEVLNRYYPRDVLQKLYRKKKFDGSETDSIRELEYNAELLRDKCLSATNDGEKNRLCEAADAFKARHEEAHYLR